MGRLLKIVGIFAILIVNDSLSQSISYPDGSCLNPQRLHGACIDIHECPPLLEILKNIDRTPEETQFLINSKCGGKDKNVLVCCRLESGSRFNVSPTPQIVDNTHLLPTTRECGISFDNRIIGGSETKIDEYPWVALIEYTYPSKDKGHHCGATLINNRYVITAAHCVTGRAIPPDWRISAIRLGEWDRSTDHDCEFNPKTGERTCSDPHVDVGIEQIITHPEYNSQAKNNLNDIALIRLSRSVSYTEYVKPVCLPVKSELRTKTFESYNMDVTGWGVTEDGTTSALKKKADVDVWAFNKCLEKYASRRIYLQSTQMCAGGKKDVDSCSGDSGGPLVVKERLDNRDVYVLAGVVSFGPTRCGMPGWPGVYTRVGAYMDWVLNNIRA